MANTIFLNLGVRVEDLFKNADKNQIQEIKKASENGFTKAELQSLEEDGIDISLIKDNSVENPAIEEQDTDSPELKEAKQQLKTINQDILNDSTKLRELEAEIILLEDEVNTEFANLVDKQNQLEEEQKDAIKEAQQKAQEKYTNSDGEMTQEEYEESLMNELNEIDSKYGSAFSAIAKGFLENNKKQAELNAKIDTQNTLVENVKTNQQKAEDLSAKITQMQMEHEAKLQAAAAAQGGGGADSAVARDRIPWDIRKMGKDYVAKYEEGLAEVKQKSGDSDKYAEMYQQECKSQNPKAPTKTADQIHNDAYDAAVRPDPSKNPAQPV